MRILMLSDLETMGGAAIATSRLAEALAGEGHEVIRLVARADNKAHAWRTEMFEPSRDIVRRVARRILPEPMRARMMSKEMSASLRRQVEKLRPDAVNAHNLHVAEWQGWGHEMLDGLPNSVPVVWTLHDMWSFTGRCIAAGDCAKFLTGCDATCPTPHEYPALAPSRIAPAWEQRRKFFAAHPQLAAVAPSNWMAAQARAGLWSRHRVEVIPNGLPLETFRPMERAAARQELRVEAHGAVFLAAAQVLSDARVGGSLLAEALENVKERPLTLLVMGTGELGVNLAGVQVHKLGYVEQEHARALAYNAADVAVYPAPVSNLSNVAVEAIACGTPVVGFAVGGMAEIVTHGETGWLAAELTPKALAAALEASLGALPSAAEIRSACRQQAEQKFCAKRQARRYVELFKSLQMRSAAGQDDRN